MSSFIDFTSLKRRSSPNSYLVAPAAINGDADQEVVIEAPAASVFESLIDLITSTKSWSLTASDTDQKRIKFVSVSPLMRFKDDVDVAILEKSPSSCDFLIYSRSRVGYSDMGANRKRVKGLVQSLRQSELAD